MQALLRTFAGSAFVFVLAACSATPSEDSTMQPAPTTRDDDATCDAEPARSFIGKTATTQVVEQARKAAGARGARTLKPGQMVTMEYNAGRLNLDVDTANVITNVRCG